MRISRLIPALTFLALLHSCGRAQTAVLVLSPSASASVVAGTGSAGFRGDGGAALSAQFAAPSAMARDSRGNIYLADTRNHRIRRVTASGTITTVAGTGVQGFAGDEGPAVQAQLDSPSGVTVLPDDTVVIADTHNQRIRRIDNAGNIHTIAGNGSRGYSGDGAAATNAQFNGPSGIGLGLVGDLYIADAGNHCIRHLSSTGIISTVAGNGTQGTSPDGTPATTAHLDYPVAVSVRSDGSVLIADRGANRIFVLQTDGTLHTLNTAALAMRRPGAVATSSSGDTLIADTGNFRIAQISGTGAGSALGSGEQGALNPNVAPVASALGATAAVIDTTSAAFPGQISVLDRDNAQLLQVNLPQLNFPDTVVATTSTPRPVLLRNDGATILSVVSVALPSFFSAASTSSCGSAPFQLAAKASCQIDLVFAPQTIGPVAGLFEVDVANGLTQRVSLAGAGLPTGSQLTSTISLQASASLNYAGMPLFLTATVLGSGASAPAGSVTFLDGGVTVLGSGALNSSGQASLATSTLTAGAHSISARYNGDVHYLGSTSAASAVSITAAPDFTVTASTVTPVIVHSSNPGTLSAVLQPISGVLNQTIAISVGGLPSGTAVTVTPVPVVLSSDPVVVNIAFKLPVSLSQRLALPTAALGLLFPLLLMVPRRRGTYALLLTAIVVLPLFLQGCGGGYLSGASVTAQSAGTAYPVTLTATCAGVTGATLTHTASFTVEVQP